MNTPLKEVLAQAGRMMREWQRPEVFAKGGHADFVTEADIAVDSPYNTHKVPGIPPRPICNPGAAAIKAALYPDKTDYYFFCHNDKGDIYLASTASQHQKNAEKVLYGN